MRAARAYRVLVGRTGRAPALLAGSDRMDHVEVVEIDTGETILFWDCRPREAGRLANRLREDLQRLEGEDFLEQWGTFEPTG